MELRLVALSNLRNFIKRLLIYNQLRDKSGFHKTAQFEVNKCVLQVGAYFKRYSSVSFQMLIGSTVTLLRMRQGLIKTANIITQELYEVLREKGTARCSELSGLRCLRN